MVSSDSQPEFVEILYRCHQLIRPNVAAAAFSSPNVAAAAADVSSDSVRSVCLLFCLRV